MNAVRVALVAAVSFASGCGILVDEQTLQFHYDEAKDRLDVLVVSRGLYASVPPPFLTSNREQKIDAVADEWLDAIQRGDRWLTSSLLPFDIDLDTAYPEPARKAAAQPYLDLIRVKHGDFFLDERGRLCLWQCFGIVHFGRFLDLVNHAMREALRDPATIDAWKKESDGVFPDARTEELLRAAAEREFTFVTTRGKALVVRAPLSRVGHRYLLGRALDGLTEQLAKDKDLPESRWWRECLSREWSLARVGELTEVVLGNPEASEQVFTLPGRETAPGNLLPHLERRRVPVHKGLPEARWLEAFREFCADDH